MRKQPPCAEAKRQGEPSCAVPGRVCDRLGTVRGEACCEVRGGSGLANRACENAGRKGVGKERDRWENDQGGTRENWGDQGEAGKVQAGGNGWMWKADWEAERLGWDRRRVAG